MRKYTLPLSLLIIATICLLPTHGVFATDPAIPEASLVTTAFSYLIKFLSRGWMILAFLAGKLMSNDWIYASSLHLDKVLFTMWNYMKNIANFILGFLLVAGVLKSLFTKNAFNFKAELPKFLLASVLINMSWFLMGALVDVSNVATAAVGAFPQALMGDSLIKDQQISKLTVSIPTKIEINNNENNNVKVYDGGLQKIDEIRGRFNDMSGPLMFLGSSILRIQDLPDLNQNITSFKSFTSAQIIKIIIVIMFIAPLAALFIINLQRVFYLWLWIIFSPLIILMDDTIIKLGKFDIGKIKEKFTFKEILGMIFAPVLVIGGMSLVLIMSTAMYYVLGGEPGKNGESQTQQTFSYGGADITSVAGKSTLSNPSQGSDISFEGDLFRDAATYAGGFVGYIIIVGFTIMLLRAIVKMSISSSKIAEGIYKKITGLGETIASSAPILPIGKDGYSLSAAKNAGLSMFNSTKSKLLDKFTEADAEHGIRSQFYNSDFGKGFAKSMKINPNSIRTPKMDLSQEQTTTLSEKLKNVHTIEALGSTIQDTMIGSNKTLDSLSNSFMNTIKNRIDDKDNTKLRQEILAHIPGYVEKDLYNLDKDTGKKFVELLKRIIVDPKMTEKIVDTPQFSAAEPYMIYSGDKPKS